MPDDTVALPSAEEFFRILDECVAERGADYVYPRNDVAYATCLYVKEGEPDCIMGLMLYKMGVPVEFMVKHEGESASVLVRDYFTGEIPRGLYYALATIQGEQDGGTPWGDAVERGKITYRSFGGDNEV